MRALESGDGAVALEVLLEVWERERLTPVAEAISRLDSKLEVEPLPAPVSQRDDYLAWVERARALRPVDVAPLLAGLREATENPRLQEHFVRGRLKLLAGFPSDPRIFQALHQLTERFPGIRWAGDFQRALRRHARAVSKGSPLEAELSEALQALARAVREARLASIDAPARAAPGVESAAEVLAAVRADPGNEALRLVAADRLGELGDPRGEFITLQLQRQRGAQTPAGLERERFLRQKHGAQWLGALAAHVVKSEAEFELGFPARVTTLANRIYKAREAAPLDEWATVREVRFGAVSYFGPSMRHLALASGVETFGLRCLLELDPLPPLEVIDVYATGAVCQGAPREWTWLELLPRLVRLKELEVVAFDRQQIPERVVEALAARLPPTLERLGVYGLPLDLRREPQRVRAIVARVPPQVKRLKLNTETLDRVGDAFERRRR